MIRIAAILLGVLALMSACEMPVSASKDRSPPEQNPFDAVAAQAYPMHELDEPLRLVDRRPIEFPRELRTKNREGTVLLLVAVDEQGRVIACQTEDADHDEIAEHVRADIAQRTFTPPTKDGQPVQAYARLPVPYRIGEGSLMKFVQDSDWVSSPRK